MPDIMTATTGRFEPELTDFAIGAGEQDLIGPLVAREVEVDDESGKYAILGREKYLVQDSSRGESDPAIRTPRSFSTDSYKAIPHSRREFISDQARKKLSRAGVAKVADKEMELVDLMAEMMNLEREAVIVDKLTTSGNYASGLYENLDTLENRNFDDASSPGARAIIKSYLSAARQKCGYPLDTLLVAENTWNELSSDPSLLPTLTGNVVLTEQQVATLLGVKRLLVGAALYTDDKPKAGASYELSQLWPSNSIVCCLCPERLTRDSSATIKTFMWNETDFHRQGRQVRTYRDNAAGAGGDWLQLDTAWDIKLTGVNSSGKIIAGALLTNCYSKL